MRFGACLWIRCREAEPRAVPSQTVYTACTGSFDWSCVSPRWCPKVVSNPGGLHLINASPSSLKRSSGSISNAEEPSEHRGAEMVDPHAVVHVISLISTQELLPISLPHPVLRFSLTPYKFELLETARVQERRIIFLVRVFYFRRVRSTSQNSHLYLFNEK